MITAPESRAHSVVTEYVKMALGSQLEERLLQKLIADDIRKAISEDRAHLRETMVCGPSNPCAFENVCGYHKALADAFCANLVAAR